MLPIGRITQLTTEGALPQTMGDRTLITRVTLASDVQSPDLTREVVTMPRPRKERKERIEPEKPYIGTREAAQILGVSETIVKRMAAHDEIQSAYKVDGKHWIMLRSDIQTIAENRK